MNILIIDDSQNNRDAAINQLVGHELTVCASYKEAEDMIRTGQGDKPYFEAVLIDLFMPASEEFKNIETPYGLAFAIGAIARGAKYVAILTAGESHHDHPIFSALYSSIKYSRVNLREAFKVMEIGNARFVCCSAWDAYETKNKGWKKVLDALIG